MSTDAAFPEDAFTHLSRSERRRELARLHAEKMEALPKIPWSVHKAKFRNDGRDAERLEAARVRRLNRRRNMYIKPLEEPKRKTRTGKTP